MLSLFLWLDLGPAFVGIVGKDWATHNSIALSWSEVEQPHLDIMDYEVKYYEKVQLFNINNTLQKNILTHFIYFF